MMNYLNQQPNPQMLADALRGTAAGGGTQMPGMGAGSQLGGGGGVPPPPQFSANGGLPPEAMDAAKAGGQWLKDNYFTGPTGADIGTAASTLGPEVAKMGGDVGGDKNSGFSGMGADLWGQISPLASLIGGGKDGKWKDMASAVSPAFMALKGLF